MKRVILVALLLAACAKRDADTDEQAAEYEGEKTAEESPSSQATTAAPAAPTPTPASAPPPEKPEPPPEAKPEAPLGSEDLPARDASGRALGWNGKVAGDWHAGDDRAGDAIRGEGQTPAEADVAYETLTKSRQAPDPNAAASPKRKNKVEEKDKGVDSDDGEERERRYRPSHEKPAAFLPRTCYFENTYLGGNAAYLERLRRLDEALAGGPHRLANADAQAFDPPERAGMALTASVDTRWLDKPGRVFLQVGLRGSDRFGWRRPPLELVLVVDAPAIAGGLGPTVEVLSALLHGLGPQDRLALVVAGGGDAVPLARLRSLQTTLPPRLASLRVVDGGPESLSSAMAAAGELLRGASEHRTTVPGTQTVLLLTSGADVARVRAAESQAHGLKLHGVVTSVVEVDSRSGAWWPVADTGHGSYHRVQQGGAGAAIEAELESLSRVVARLLRVNVRLAPGVEAVRVLGSRVLDEATVRAVKAREVATDKNLALTTGIAADRGGDDDGIQSVIPYFLGGESHVIVIELWVEKPGKIADVTLRYKDMVTLGNATASAAAELRNVPRPDTGEQVAVFNNLRGFRVAEALSQAADRLAAGDSGSALGRLRAAQQDARSGDDRQLVSGFERLVASQPGPALADALRLAAERRIGEPRR